jgi:signal transduction histidine kinase
MLRRAVITLVFGAGVPMGVLSYLAVGSIANERGEEAQKVEERAQRAAEAVARGLDEHLTHAEDTLVHQMKTALARSASVVPPDDDPDVTNGFASGVASGSLPPLNDRGKAAAAALDAMVAETFVREPFLTSSGGRMLLPWIPRPPPAHEQDRNDQDLVRSARVPDTTRESDLGDADSVLYHDMQVCEDEDLRCVLRMKQAEIAWRRGDAERALALLRVVRAREWARGPDGEAVYPIATQRFAEWAVRAGHKDEALDELLKLGDGLADDRWQMEATERKALLDEVAGDAELLVKELAGENAASLTRRLKHMRSRAAFLDGFDDHVLPEVRRRVHPVAPGELVGAVTRIGMTIDGEPRLVAVAALEGAVTAITSSRPAHVQRPAVVGLDIDLEAVRSQLTLEIAAVDSDARVAVVDAFGKLFAGDEALATAPVQGIPLDTAPTTSSGLAAFAGWRVMAVPRDPEAPARLARGRLMVSLGLVATCALVALAAFAFSLRAASREVEVAKVRGDLVRNVSHELRTPVASILMLSEVLEEGGLEPPKQADYVTRIAKEARRLSRLIENVLDLARVEQGARKIDPQPLVLGEVVGGAVEAFRMSEEGRDANVGFDDASQGAVVPVDSVAIEQILGNFLSNAVKYSPPGEPVAVSVSATAVEATIVVRDRGRGLTKEELDRLFAPFFRARPEQGASGVGLGLVIARELIRLHGGRLSVESVPGSGSSFAVILPRGPA